MIKIAQLYPDELTLYGESGNIKAITYELNKKDIAYEIIKIDKEDELNFDEYDFIYIGSGRKSSLEDVKRRLLPYKNDILSYIEQEKIMLVTGNAISIFSFLDLYDIAYFDKRIVLDVMATTSLCKGIIKGFQNTEYLIDSTKNILFNMDNGCGNNGTKMEGYQYQNFYATSIIGPILARNDNLCNYFINILSKECNK